MPNFSISLDCLRKYKICFPILCFIDGILVNRFLGHMNVNASMIFNAYAKSIVNDSYTPSSMIKMRISTCQNKHIERG